ncbi:MAG: hypothetical protein KAV87_64720 [Desulfobacteraceae bacterium]|nr:hypothetical protein [Desulfobacteraceae bacterium]
MTTILTEVSDILLDEIPDIDNVKVDKVCLGLGYSGVKLHSGQAGVCNSLLSDMALGCCQILQSAGTLAGRSAREFIEMTGSWNMIERVFGVATLNALSQIVFEANPNRYAVEDRNLIELIELEPDDVVVLVGFIKPFVRVFRSKAKKLYILDRNVQREEGVMPDSA